MTTQFPSLIVFGSQAGTLSKASLLRLRSLLHGRIEERGIVEAMHGLLAAWDALVAFDPQLDGLDGRNQLEQLVSLLGGHVDDEQGLVPASGTNTTPMPNMLLAPLTVLIHMVEYFSYLKHVGTSHRKVLQSVARNGGFQGLCIGLLSAIAMSTSEDEVQAIQVAARALNLALAIGAYVDLDARSASPPGLFSCFVVRWKQQSDREQVLGILEQFPQVCLYLPQNVQTRGGYQLNLTQAYISVTLDDSNVTITADRQSSRDIMNSLNSIGAVTKPIPLNGRFHTRGNKERCAKVVSLGQSDARFRLPGSASLHTQVFGGDGEPIDSNELQETALRSILVDQAEWHKALVKALYRVSSTPSAKPLVISLGPVDCIPHSLVNKYSLDIATSASFGGLSAEGSYPTYADDSIAIVGMACRLPGADNLDEFWQLLLSGSSMLGRLPGERFATTGLRRSRKEDTPFLGNFVRDAFAFDHKFFNKSSLEARSMDPQHKLILQVAYEALESAGYFSRGGQPRDVGCYIGVAASDYEDNVASHAPTAFSVTGAVRAFVSGKISHFFGLSGPSLVFDTACSSSAVAIHTACQAIRSGDCSMALAGGVNVITSPTLHQNLAAANFLSPTGESKSFDARADGYCRGEGAGVLMLKRYSAAVADGDNIFGVIAGSAVNQNANTAPITVPVSSSQTSLYMRVLQRAHMDPKSVSYVEAHGTGTPKGDPIECASIREVFGNQLSRKLYFSSVKGSIGHLEGASGVAGIIRVLLMMQHRTITPQTSFRTLNPSIPPLLPSNMEIPEAPKPWETDFMAGIVNNYGAAGSNAAVLICQPPPTQPGSDLTSARAPDNYPIMIHAKSIASLSANCNALLAYLDHQAGSHSPPPLASIAYWASMRRNPELPFSWKARVRSLEGLRDELKREIEALAKTTEVQSPAKGLGASEKLPVVLVFSGQTGRLVKISREAYDSSVLLKRHMDSCDAIVWSLGYPRIFPAVFTQEPIADIVTLHCAIFTVQYACAQSWIDAGLQVQAVIGHSFGQLTALCVAGAMSLEDGIRLIAGRAALVQSAWGNERGAMVSIDVDSARAQQLVMAARERNIDVEVACYNAPKRQVIVGSEAAVASFENFVSQNQQGGLASPALKRLEVTHGFHSKFVNNILPGYRDLIKSIRLRQPHIPVETCSPGRAWEQVTAELVSAQSREPVYFGEAVSRLQARHGPCLWLEAGSGSAAIPLVRQALELRVSEPSPHSFHPVDLGGKQPRDTLADVTLGLWSKGVRIQFWPFHHVQRNMYAVLHLPPYQFEKHHHSLEYIDKHVAETEVIMQPMAMEKRAGMVSLVEKIDAHTSVSRIEQTNHVFINLIEGHRVLGNPLCPLSLYIEMATRAAALLTPGFKQGEHVPEVCDLEIFAPLGRDTSREVQITLEESQQGGGNQSWDVTFSSFPHSQPTKKVRHASASISMLPSKNRKMAASFERTQRLIDTKKCKAMFASDASAGIKGALVYKMFDKVVNYSAIYRGVQKISSQDREVAGYILLPPPTPAASSPSQRQEVSICNPLAIDNFTQVAGLHVNGLDDCGNDEVYICSKVEQLQINQGLALEDTAAGRGPWLVYSNFVRSGGDRDLLSDLYILDERNGVLVMTILGVRFTKTNVHSLQRVLARANMPSIKATAKAWSHSSGLLTSQKQPAAKEHGETLAARSENPRTEKLRARMADEVGVISVAVRHLLNEVVDVPLDAIRDETLLSELGIDSLMSTEVLNAINDQFSVQISADLLRGDFGSLCAAISASSDTSSISHSSECNAASSYEHHSGWTTSTFDSTAYATPVVEADPEATSKLEALVAEHLDITGGIARDVLLEEVGVDSLLGTELGSAIEHEFGIKIDMGSLPRGFRYGDLVNVIISHKTREFKEPPPPSSTGVQEAVMGIGHSSAVPNHLGTTSEEEWKPVEHADEDFAAIRGGYQHFAQEAGYAGFRTRVYPKQRKLVAVYVLQAFSALGCNVASLKPGEALPAIAHIPKHAKVMGQYYMILCDESLLRFQEGKYVRTDVPIEEVDTARLHEELSAEFPQHAGELKLLRATGTRLADVLSGKTDPLHILFGSKADRDLLEDVYLNSPMWLTGTKVLTGYLMMALLPGRRGPGAGRLRILELGAGTGGTTRHLLQTLSGMGVDFTYTFTDLSSSLVAAAKRKFAQYGGTMEYTVLDVEKAPPQEHIGRYDIVVSSNCIHATKDLFVSSTNLRKLLRDNGVLCLLELTRNIYWLDCVFGLLEGWWLFEDGRRHALASETLWRDTLLRAGFRHVKWSDDASEESDQYRLIASFVTAPTSRLEAVRPGRLETRDTVEYANLDSISLQADLYYPQQSDAGKPDRPVALMIHGGGHIMLSRRDIRPRQTRLLLQKGFLPVSIDYRLCPEMTLTEGPMTDVCTALHWARTQLPALSASLSRPDVRADGSRVAVVGWSTGGTLAMSLSWTAPSRGIRPPDAILAFYCPSDYESDFWRLPNFPENTRGAAEQAQAQGGYDLLEGVRAGGPITAYNVTPPRDGGRGAVGGWMSLLDPRSRIALHMNWRGQTLPTLLDGLPSRAAADADVDWENRPQPDAARVAAVSALARVRAGDYSVPTFLIHGTADDLVPVEHTQRIRDMLMEKGVPSGLAVVDGAVHLFDLYPDTEGKHWAAVQEGYEFLVRHLGM
ncbi:beta-ketoacyl synthase domain-containing protein [Colletotrichum falcatum]|nr:beta-ketoacyl synthase domain-containing protein [Colletotrichum falcatum]